jgi:hypothetical protein
LFDTSTHRHTSPPSHRSVIEQVQTSKLATLSLDHLNKLFAETEVQVTGLISNDPHNSRTHSSYTTKSPWTISMHNHSTSSNMSISHGYCIIYSLGPSSSTPFPDRFSMHIAAIGQWHLQLRCPAAGDSCFILVAHTFAFVRNPFKS